MTVRWSPEAAADFAAIVEYIRKQNPSAAERVARKIYAGVAALASFPNQGRPGRTKGTRELAFFFASSLCCCVPSKGRRGGNCARATWGATLAVRWLVCAAGVQLFGGFSR
jgi:ParE toxin of type II toxin-antitoxin system, parDE